MIEIPRAAITAGEVAKHAEFFSFWTNDLTQTGLGLSMTSQFLQPIRMRFSITPSQVSTKKASASLWNWVLRWS